MATKKSTKKKAAKRTASKKVQAAPPIMLYSSGLRRTAQMQQATTSVTSANSPQYASMSPLFYDYRWSSPDKFYFPRSRAVANRIWREVYIRDPAVAAATDMYAELPWSTFDITGIDDADIRKTYEDMFNEINLVPKMPNLTKDFLITGELILHAIFNSSRGIWERVISHNPDYIRVEGMGLAFEQPLLWLRPTPEIRKLINSPDPKIRQLQKLIPKDILNAFRMNKEVALDPLNTTYIPRLTTSTSLRGTSLYTRLFRVIMYEDFIVNASLAVAQRNAAPLRIFKLGDPKTDWLPNADVEAQFAEMLAAAESDPLGAIIMHHNVSVEYAGVSDKVILISREWDFIERVKLLALGVAKSYLMGETSFAASVAGLQILMERLAALRNKFEQEWIIKRLCEPIAEMHEFYKRSKSELDHRIRMQRPEERQLIVPQLKWHKSLDAVQDVSVLSVWDRLYGYGMLSERTYAAGAGVDLEVERKNKLEEAKFQEERQKELEDLGIAPEEEEEPEMGGAPLGRGAPPPPPPEASLKRRGNANPYGDYPSDEPHFQDKQAELEERLSNLVDTENKIHIDEVLETVQDVEDDNIIEMRAKASNLNEAQKMLPPAGKGLLTG
jgi:hypothetical protein